MHARRSEDQQACACLTVRPVWCALLDAQYGSAYTVAQVRDMLRPLVLRQSHSIVLAPLGLFHSDHVLVSDAAQALCQC